MKVFYHCFTQAFLLLTVLYMVGQTNAADLAVSPLGRCYEQRVFEKQELRQRFEICFEPDVLMFCDALYGALTANGRLIDAACTSFNTWYIKNNILYFKDRETNFSSQCSIKMGQIKQENDGMTLSGCPDFDRFPDKWQLAPQD